MENNTTTGIDGLDDLLDGGFPADTVVLLAGGPGSGKTLFGLNYLINPGSDKDSRCCYISFNESKEELLRACNQIASLKNASKMLDKQLSLISLELGEEMDVAKFIKLISSYPDLDKLVLDNVNKLLMHSSDDREYRINLSKLVGFLRKKVGCTLLLCETMNDSIDTGHGEGFECDGIIKLCFSELEEKPKRVLEVHKMRYTSFDPMVLHELRINSKGLSLEKASII